MSKLNNKQSIALVYMHYRMYWKAVNVWRLLEGENVFIDV